MSEEPKTIWKKALRIHGWWQAWLILVAVIFLLVTVIGEITGNVHNWLDRWRALFQTLVSSMVVATVFVGFWMFIRWIFCWRNFRHFLFGLACFATLIALLYAEEDWRGKHDFEKFKREWEAKGEKFDYAGNIPPPVPDDQNFAMAPIWVESMKAVLGPKNSRQWFGDNYAENGRTNFLDRLEMNIIYEDRSAMPDKIVTPKSGNRQKGELTDLSAWQNYYRNPALTNCPIYERPQAYTNDFPTSPQPQTPAQDVLLALSKYDSAVEELRAASLRPFARFPVYSDADHPFDTLLPHLAELKRCAQVLQLRAIAELQNGESEKALADVKLMLRLGDLVRTEPYLISQLVRIALLQITLQPIYEGLAEHRWTDAQLVTLDAELAKLDFLADYESSLRGERACSIAALDYIRRTGDLGLLQETGEHHQELNLSFLMPSAFFYQNELTIVRIHQQCVLAMVDAQRRIVSPKTVKNLQKQSYDDTSHYWWPYKIFAKMLFPALQRSVEKFAYAQSSTDLSRTAIALERYRLSLAEFPESLDALAPQFIAQLPHDIINGEPLKYRRSADGNFVLYSVGWNETNDGGVVVFEKGSTPVVDKNRGDWVWRYPQK